MSAHRILGCVLLAALAAAAPVAAAGGEGGADAHSPIGLLFRWINFAVMAAGFAWLLRKAPAWFRGRAETIASSIEASGSARAEADRRLREAEEKMARLGEDVAALRAQAQRDAAAERERIRAAARDEAAKIESAAEGEIAAAERAARMELKATAARLAVEQAETDIRARMSPQAGAALLRAFVSELASGSPGRRP